MGEFVDSPKRTWCYGTYQISLHGTSIVHAYPHAEFIDFWVHDDATGMVSFLDAEPLVRIDGTAALLADPLTKPNGEEIEYEVTVLEAGDHLDEPLPKIIGTALHNGKRLLAVVAAP